MQPANNQRYTLSLTTVILIFVIFFVGFVGSIVYAGYYYLWPKVLQLRQQALQNQQVTPSSTADPQELERVRKKQAFTEANKKINEQWEAEQYREATISAKFLLENATSSEEIANAHTWNGYVLTKLNKPKDAEAEFKKAIELNSEYTEAYQGLDQIYYNRKDYKSMLANADKVLSYNPNSSTFHNERGVALDGLGRYNEAQTAYRKAIELDPTNEVARDNLQRSQE